MIFPHKLNMGTSTHWGRMTRWLSFPNQKLWPKFYNNWKSKSYIGFFNCCMYIICPWYKVRFRYCFMTTTTSDFFSKIFYHLITWHGQKLYFDKYLAPVCFSPLGFHGQIWRPTSKGFIFERNAFHFIMKWPLSFLYFVGKNDHYY